MEGARVLYSFVVDADRKFQDQAEIFCRTLISTGVAPDAIHAQLTPLARENGPLVAMLRGFGVTLANLEPFLDGKYCNKLAQMGNLPLGEADFIVLCDTDLAFAEENVDALLQPGVVRAKPVDLPNPPLEMLFEAQRRCGVAGEPRLLRTSCSDGLTFATNCNGGLYILPAEKAELISERWREMARRLFADTGFLSDCAHHIDQISFSLAMLDLGLDVLEIPLEYNFPSHLSDKLDSEQQYTPRIIHYHWLHDGARALRPCGRADVDGVVELINGLLAQPAQFG